MSGRSRRRIPAALVAALLVAPAGGPAQASGSHEIEVVTPPPGFDPYFRPVRAWVEPGDEIVWNWRYVQGAEYSPRFHNVTSYQGQAFASPTMPTGQFRWVYLGGVVKYRCTVHSVYDPPSDTCAGMCGRIDDDTAAPPKPAFTSPSPASVVADGDQWFTVARSSEATRIVIRDGPDVLLDRPAQTWPNTEVESFALTLGAGEYALTATIQDHLGQWSLPSDALALTVLPDPPAPVITVPAQGASVTSPVQVSGTASGGATAVDVFESSSGLTVRATVTGGAWSVPFQLGGGTRTLTARSFNVAGAPGAWSSAVSVIVQVSSTAPVIDSPAEGAIRTYEAIQGTAVPGTTSVRLFDGGQHVATLPVQQGGVNAGFWSGHASLPSGVRVLTAQGIGLGFESAISEPRTIVQDNLAPTASFDAPAPNAVARSPVHIAGAASDDVVVDRLLVTLRDRRTGFITVYEATCSLCGTGSASWRDDVVMPAGAYTSTVRAYDRAGRQSVVEGPAFVVARACDEIACPESLLPGEGPPPAPAPDSLQSAHLVMVPASGDGAASMPLTAEATYRIEAHGAFAYALPAADRLADARCVFAPPIWVADPYGGNLLGLEIDGAPAAWTPEPGTVQPVDPRCSTTHSYRASVVGSGIPIHFSIRDGSPNDNAGGLVVRLVRVA